MIGAGEGESEGEGAQPTVAVQRARAGEDELRLGERVAALEDLAVDVLDELVGEGLGHSRGVRGQRRGGGTW